ncbi:hypothetical protein BH23CHL2_BH23CHL2_12580 [soil metagenome]
MPLAWGKNTTLMAAMPLAGVKTAAVIEGAIDRPVFDQFIEQFLVLQLRSGQIIIWHNLSVHQSGDAEELIEVAGCQVVPLPPDSPDFNPIEQIFSNLKAHLRRANQRSVEGFWDAIGEELDLITTGTATPA